MIAYCPVCECDVVVAPDAPPHYACVVYDDSCQIVCTSCGAAVDVGYADWYADHAAAEADARYDLEREGELR